MSRLVKRMFSIILIFIIVLATAPLSGFIGIDLTSWFSITASAIETGICGENLTWSYDLETKELIITGSGELSGYTYYNQLPWHSYRSQIKKLVIGDGVTYIGDYTFYNCYSINELIIPVSVEISNSNYPFWGCTNIKRVTMTKGTGIMQNYGSNPSSSSPPTCYQFTPWYHSRNKLSEIIIENGVKNIGNYGFAECENITSIELPKTIESIGEYAFYGCSKLEFLELPSKLKNIGKYAFSGLSLIKDLVVPDGVVSIEQGAFNGMNNLASIKIPFIGNNISSTGPSGVFGYIFGYETKSNVSGTIYQTSEYKMPVLTKYYYYIPTSLRKVIITKDTTISENAFNNCSFLTVVSFVEPVTLIDDYAFDNCSGLKKFEFGGTEEEWNNLEIGINNDALYNATIHYNDPVTVKIEAYTEVDGSAAWSKQFGISISSDDENAPLPDVTYSVIDEYGCISFSILITEDDLQGMENKSFKYTLTISSTNGKKYDFSPETQTVEVTINNTNGKLTQTNNLEVYEFIGYSYYDYEITLTWDDHDNICGARPSIVEMVLVSDQRDESIPITLSKDNRWRTVLSVRKTNDEFKNHRYSVDGLNSDVGYRFNIYPYEDTYGKGVDLVASLSVCMVGFYTTQGTSTESQYVVSGSLVAKPEDPESDYYNFVGWYKDKDCTQGQEWDFETDVVFKNTVLYAKWEAKSIEITLKTDYGFFEGNRNEITMTIPACSAVGIKLSEEMYDSNYNHIGWVDEEGNVVTATTKLYEDTTLYAVWQKKPYYDSLININNNIGSKTINYGETLKLSVNTTNLPDGSKICWYIDGVKKAEGEVFDVNFEGGTKIITVKIISFDGNVLKDVNGNEISDSETVTVKAGFFQKLISFFKNLFGANRTVVQTIFKGTF